MTREQLEANWQWDPVRGDIPFRRPRITPKNIADQKALARPRTLVHWEGASRGWCSRKDSGIDANTWQIGQTTVTESGNASHVGNVNCLQCRQLYFKWQRHA